MSTTNKEPIDKSTWGEGPWQTEPDRVEFEHVGFPCLAVRGPMGAWCGYVAVPEGHPWYGNDGFSNGQSLDVHGGVTYGDHCQGNICHIPKPGEPDNVWWVGFDCVHVGDFAPGLESRLRPVAAGMVPKIHSFETYKNIDYIKRETLLLAEQAQRATQ